MEIAILLFEGITALDAVGPYEVLSRLPDSRVKFVAREPGLKRTDNHALGLMADFSLEQCTNSEIILIPGGWGTEKVVQDPIVLEWIKVAHLSSQWTTSVCTGSLVLGAAGILNGLRATSHWSALSQLREFGALPMEQRIVRANKIVTSAGVSAGIDMALALAHWISGEDIAQAIQLSMEYAPCPPFNSGTPSKAPAAIVELVKSGRLRRKK